MTVNNQVGVVLRIRGFNPYCGIMDASACCQPTPVQAGPES